MSGAVNRPDRARPGGGFPLREDPAPAKINLYLKVVGRRPDQYHDLDTLMARLDVADRVGLAWAEGPAPDRLELRGAPPGTLPADFFGPDNLALKAAALYRARTGWPETGVVVGLEKNLPLGAGLGGGSSDGAAVLRLLNRAAPRPLADGDLAAMGLALGSDVPFFLQPLPLARALGRGEILGPPPDSFRVWAGRRVTLVNPGFQLSTGLVFKNLRLTNSGPDTTLGPAPAPGENDLCSSALTLAPDLARICTILEAARAASWGMSGSGPTFWLYRPEVPVWLGQPDWWVREAAILS